MLVGGGGLYNLTDASGVLRIDGVVAVPNLKGSPSRLPIKYVDRGDADLLRVCLWELGVRSAHDTVEGVFEPSNWDAYMLPQQQQQQQQQQYSLAQRPVSASTADGYEQELLRLFSVQAEDIRALPNVTHFSSQSMWGKGGRLRNQPPKRYLVVFDDFGGLEALLRKTGSGSLLAALRSDLALYLETVLSHGTSLAAPTFTVNVKEDASDETAGLHLDFAHNHPGHTVKYLRMVGPPELTTVVLSTEGRDIPLFTRRIEYVSLRTQKVSHYVNHPGAPCYHKAGFFKALPAAAIFNSNRPHAPPDPNLLRGRSRALISFQNDYDA